MREAHVLDDPVSSVPLLQEISDVEPGITKQSIPSETWGGRGSRGFGDSKGIRESLNNVFDINDNSSYV